MKTRFIENQVKSFSNQSNCGNRNVLKSDDINRRQMMSELPPILTESKSKVVLFYKNGDRNFRGHHVTITPRRFRNFDNLLSELTRITKLPQGARFIFTPATGTRIISLDQLSDGKAYVCGSHPKLKKINYGHAPDGSNRKRNRDKNFIPAHASNNKMKIANDVQPSNIKPKIITVVRNGIGRPKKSVKILLNKRTAQTYDQVLNDITSTVGVDGGCVRKLFNTDGKLVRSLSELFSDNLVFIAVGNERLRISDLPLIIADHSGKLNSSRSSKVQNLSKSTSPPPSNKVCILKKSRLFKSHPDISSKNHSKSPTLSHRKLPTIKPRTNQVRKGTPRKIVEKNYKIEKVNDSIEMQDSNCHIFLEDGILPHIGNEVELNNSDQVYDTNEIVLNKKIPLPSIKSSHSGSTISEKREDEYNITPSSESELSNLETNHVPPNSNIKPKEKDGVDYNTVGEDKQTEIVHVDMDIQLDTDINDKVSTTDSEEIASIYGGSNASVENTISSSKSQIVSNSSMKSNVTTSASSKTEKVLEDTQAKNINLEMKSKSTTSQSSSSVSVLSKDDSISVTSKDSEVKKLPSEKISDNDTDTNIESPLARKFKNYQLSSSTEINSYYELSDTLGDGNFAVVKIAKDRSTGMMYALKIIDVSKIKGKEDMLRNEIRIQRDCCHPNIVQLIHDFHSSNEIFLVMELVTGGDFFDLIAENIRLEEEEASVYTRDLCSGLDYLHRRNIVHRDIKPENLLVCSKLDGSTMLKIADFGLAQEVTSPIFTICGTPTYVSPEILKEEGYGLEVDIWAAGVIIFIMLCGFPPFRSPNRKQSELFDLIETGEFEFTEPYWDDVSDQAKNLITHMLLVDVKLRFNSKQVLAHRWLTQYGLTRNNTMDITPRSSMFKIVGKSIQSIERMKNLAGARIKRGENII